MRTYEAEESAVNSINTLVFFCRKYKSDPTRKKTVGLKMIKNTILWKMHRFEQEGKLDLDSDYVKNIIKEVYDDYAFGAEVLNNMFSNDEKKQREEQGGNKEKIENPKDINEPGPSDEQGSIDAVLVIAEIRFQSIWKKTKITIALFFFVALVYLAGWGSKLIVERWQQIEPMTLVVKIVMVVVMAGMTVFGYRITPESKMDKIKEAAREFVVQVHLWQHEIEKIVKTRKKRKQFKKENEL